ncbi:30S ribosomal protein S6 [Bacteroidia bacterium]|nr:30S ribosomal protein S6 [Bacteroidia bacterium]
MNHYETVFILNPILSEPQVKEAVDKFRKVITEHSGVVSHEENWGAKHLAYPIEKKSTGFYALLQFEADGEVVEKLELAYRRDENVMRFLTFKLDKDALAYAERRRNKLHNKEK